MQHSALDSKSAWDESAPTLEVFRDSILALLTIWLVYHLVRWYQSSPEPAADPPPSHPQHQFPAQPDPLILDSCTAHVTTAVAAMQQHGVHPKRGFLPPRDPSTVLTNAQCEEWEWIGTTLPDLLSAGQCRQVLRTMKLIDWQCVGNSRAQQRRAFLLLSAMANAYLWCEPDNIVDVIPSNIAVPLCGIAQALGIQPALVHASIVLANWRRLDPKGPVTTDNITTLVDILGGRDEKWFFLLTVEIEYVGAPALLPCLLVTSAANAMGDLIARLDPTVPESTHDTGSVYDLTLAAWMAYVCSLLSRMESAIENMTTSFSKMKQKCDPYIFYHRVRPFLSGTKGNPTIPHGVVYEGVYNNERQQCSGGSAAQSTLLPIFDSALGIKHESSSSSEFIKEMREYMPKEHRAFIVYLHDRMKRADRQEGKEIGRGGGGGLAGVLRVLERLPPGYLKRERKDFIQHYNSCIAALTRFRNTHMEMVKVYIIAEQRKAAIVAAKEKGEKTLGDAAGGKGTGGTGIMSFLKPVRNRTRERHQEKN